MYPQVTSQIASLIKLRYRLIPYLYELLWQSTQAYEPVLKPTFAEFPEDRRCYDECDDMMIGAWLLAAPVVDPGHSERTVYLPAGARWVSYWSGEAFDGGCSVTLPAPWDQPVMLIREGGVIALNVAEQHFDRRADQRGFLVVPAQGAGEAVGGCIEDDGETEAWREGQHGRWNVRAMSDAHTVTLHVSREGRMPTQADTVEILLPAGDSRTVQTPQARVLETAVEGGWRRLTLQLRA
jgi:alpha-glucosidase